MGMIILPAPTQIPSLTMECLSAFNSNQAYDVSSVNSNTYVKIVARVVSQWSSAGAGCELYLYMDAVEKQHNSAAGNAASTMEAQYVFIRGTDYNAGDIFNINFSATAGGGASNTIRQTIVYGVRS